MGQGRGGGDEHCKEPRLLVCADGCGLPSAVVAAGVALVQLVLVLRVPARVQQRHAEGPQPAVLRVPLQPPAAQRSHEEYTTEYSLKAAELLFNAL